MPRDQEGTRIKGWIQSNVLIGPVSDMKVCNLNERYSIEVQVQSLFQDQTVSWIRIVNGVDKFVREVMPIQEEEKASGKPAQFRCANTAPMARLFAVGSERTRGNQSVDCFGETRCKSETNTKTVINK